MRRELATIRVFDEPVVSESVAAGGSSAKIYCGTFSGGLEWTYNLNSVWAGGSSFPAVASFTLTERSTFSIIINAVVTTVRTTNLPISDDYGYGVSHLEPVIFNTSMIHSISDSPGIINSPFASDSRIVVPPIEYIDWDLGEIVFVNSTTSVNLSLNAVATRDPGLVDIGLAISVGGYDAARDLTAPYAQGHITVIVGENTEHDCNNYSVET